MDYICVSTCKFDFVPEWAENITLSWAGTWIRSVRQEEIFFWICLFDLCICLALCHFYSCGRHAAFQFYSFPKCLFSNFLMWRILVSLFVLLSAKQTKGNHFCHSAYSVLCPILSPCLSHAEQVVTGSLKDKTLSWDPPFFKILTGNPDIPQVFRNLESASHFSS